MILGVIYFGFRRISLAEYIPILRVYFPLVVDDLLYQGFCKYCLSPDGWRRLDHGHDLCSLIWMLLRAVINEPVFVFELGCVSQTICFRMFYKTCFVITMTLCWCNLFANVCECCNVRYVMLNYCDLGCMQVGFKSFEISVDYRVYMGSSSRIWSFRRLFLYLCSYKFVGSVTNVKKLVSMKYGRQST